MAKFDQEIGIASPERCLQLLSSSELNPVFFGDLMGLLQTGWLEEGVGDARKTIALKKASCFLLMPMARSKAPRIELNLFCAGFRVARTKTRKGQALFSNYLDSPCAAQSNVVLFIHTFLTLNSTPECRNFVATVRQLCYLPKLIKVSRPRRHWCPMRTSNPARARDSPAKEINKTRVKSC